MVMLGGQCESASRMSILVAARDVGGHVLQRLFQVRGVVLAAQLHLEVAAADEQVRHPDRFGRGVELTQRRGRQRDPALELPGVMGGRHRLLEHAHVVRVDPLGGVRHLIPQLEHAGQQGEPLGGRDRPARLRGRPPGADQRPGRVVRRVPVVSHLDGGPAGRNQRRVGVDGLGEPAVQAAVLARQQVVVHGLADQLVPERVAVTAGVQHVGGHRGTYRAGQRRVVQAAHRGRAARARSYAPPALATRSNSWVSSGSLPDALQQQVTEGLRQLPAYLAVTAEQRLDEQRVALGPVVQRLGQVPVRLAAQDAHGQLAGVLPGQPLQLDPLHPGDPVQRGQQRAQRMGAVQLVGAVRDHDQQPAERPLVPDQERQQVPAGPVGPVRVLDHQHHRRVPGQVLERPEYLLEQPGPGLGRVTAGVWLTELGQQPGQPPRGPAGQHRGHRVCAHLVHQVAQHRGERCERKPVGAKLQAAAGQHPGARRRRGPAEVADQPGLTYARLPAQQHGRRTALAHADESGFQGGHLLGPSDQDGAGRSPAHLWNQHPTRG